MEDKDRVGFLIDKLLTVSEKTIESLVKLKEEYSISSKDHESHKEKIDAVIDTQKDIENLLNSFKDRRPFEVLERIEDKQDKNINDLTNVKERLFNNDINTDITEIKTTVNQMNTRDDKIVLWLKVMSALPTIALILMFIYQIVFNNIKIKEEKHIKKIIKEVITQEVKK